MKTKHVSRSAFFNRRFLIGFAFCLAGLLLAFLALYPGSTVRAQGAQQNQSPPRPPLLTPEEAQKMAAGIQQLANQSTDGLVQKQRPNGAVSIDLQGRFQNVMLAKKEADGTVAQACVDNVDTAAAFLEIDPQLVGGKPRTAPLPGKLEVR
jgi:hypothetical protein